MTLKFEPEFEKFWEIYDKKRGRKMAEKRWKKLSIEDKWKIMSHVPKYVASTPDKQYRKDASAYLNQESYHDEIIEAKSNGRSAEYLRSVILDPNI